MKVRRSPARANTGTRPTKSMARKMPDGPHAGDMNNVTVAADGTAKATISAPGVTLADGAN